MVIDLLIFKHQHMLPFHQFALQSGDGTHCCFDSRTLKYRDGSQNVQAARRRDLCIAAGFNPARILG